MVRLFEATVEVTVRKKIVISGDMTEDQAREIIGNLGQKGGVSIGHFQQYETRGLKQVPVEQALGPVTIVDMNCVD